MSPSVKQSPAQMEVSNTALQAEIGYNFVCRYVCKEGLVSFHTSSGCVVETLSIVATPQ